MLFGTLIFFFFYYDDDDLVCQSPNNSAPRDNYHTAVETANRWKIAGSLEMSEVEERQGTLRVQGQSV